MPLAEPVAEEVAEGVPEVVSVDVKLEVAVDVGVCVAEREREAVEEARAEGSLLEDDGNILAELQAVYDALCVAAMSRLVQISRLRSSPHGARPYQ